MSPASSSGGKVLAPLTSLGTPCALWLFLAALEFGHGAGVAAVPQLGGLGGLGWRGRTGHVLVTRVILVILMLLVLLVPLVLSVKMQLILLLVPFVTLVLKPWGAANSTSSPDSAWGALEKRGDLDLDMQVEPTASM